MRRRYRKPSGASNPSANQQGSDHCGPLRSEDCRVDHRNDPAELHRSEDRVMYV